MNESSLLQKQPQLLKALGKLLKLCLHERSTDNTYNYWLRTSASQITRHIPDDWDDTALAYSLLSEYPESQTVRAFYSLKQARQRSASLFQTWIIPRPIPKKWQDEDLWVNLNIAFWLALEGVVIADFWKVCVEGIIEHKQTSRYYLDYRSADFFYTRTALLILERSPEKLAQPLRKITQRGLTTVKERVLASLKESRYSIERAWSLATLALMGELNREQQTLLQKSIKDYINQEHIKLEPTILGWQQKNKTIYDCSPALTAALLLSAIPSEAKPREEIVSVPLNLLNAPIKALVEKLLKSDFSEEVAQIPSQIAFLIGSETKNIAKIQALANLVGWAYYWVDDQQIDNHPFTLPKSLSKKELWECYATLQRKVIPNDTSFWRNWRKIKNQYEKATANEINRRIENWEKHYSSKFAPYLLAVEASLITGNYSEKQRRVWKSMYNHYLLAKQISDDGRDCLEDIRAGRLTICTEKLYSQLKKPVEYHTDQEIEAIFLETVADKITLKVLDHCRQSLRRLAVLSPEKGQYSQLEKRLRTMQKRMHRLQLERKEVVVIQASSATASTGIS